MESWALSGGIELLSVAVTAFVATNVDDFVLLAALFGSGKHETKHVVIGLLLGIGLLVFVSSVAAIAALSIPPGWTNLLGIFPLAIGVRGAITWFRYSDDEVGAPTFSKASERRGILNVASLTIANGGDNLAVYIPLFASSAAGIPKYASVFAVMTLLWCLLGRLLVSHRITASLVERYGHVFVPVILFGLGLRILSGAFVLLR
jgi:cadmium resistance protein CadD (predicted permease)